MVLTTRASTPGFFAWQIVSLICAILTDLLFIWIARSKEPADAPNSRKTDRLPDQTTITYVEIGLSTTANPTRLWTQVHHSSKQLLCVSLW